MPLCPFAPLIPNAATVAATAAEGSLVHVLPEWILGRFSIYVALPSRKRIPVRTRAFLDFVNELVGDVQARAGIGIGRVTLSRKARQVA